MSTMCRSEAEEKARREVEEEQRLRAQQERMRDEAQRREEEELQAERERIAENEREARKRAEDQNHREMIIGEVEQAIIELIRRLDDDDHIVPAIVAAIASGEIPHVRMEF